MAIEPFAKYLITFADDYSLSKSILSGAQYVYDPVH